MKRNSSKGFTLVELLIVIAIIGLLMALLVVLIQGLMDRARYAKTQSMVKAMMVGCEMYKADFAGQEDPMREAQKPLD